MFCFNPLPTWDSSRLFYLWESCTNRKLGHCGKWHGANHMFPAFKYPHKCTTFIANRIEQQQQLATHVCTLEFGRADTFATKAPW
ncbi:hypothetical protein FOVSG1_009248 [Fusarium oxysporum f. sp. vasinfectum]